MEKAEVAGIGRRSQIRLVSEVEAHGEEAVIKLAIATEFEMVVQTDVRKSVGEEFRKRFAMGGHLRKGPSLRQESASAQLVGVWKDIQAVLLLSGAEQHVSRWRECETEADQFLAGLLRGRGSSERLGAEMAHDCYKRWWSGKAVRRGSHNAAPVVAWPAASAVVVPVGSSKLITFAGRTWQ